MLLIVPPCWKLETCKVCYSAFQLGTDSPPLLPILQMPRQSPLRHLSAKLGTAKEAEHTRSCECCLRCETPLAIWTCELRVVIQTCTAVAASQTCAEEALLVMTRHGEVNVSGDGLWNVTLLPIAALLATTAARHVELANIWLSEGALTAAVGEES
mmetsp:Transcript_32976/g.60377  ORF Transcript_32976/g.60377 Transcript_32976/m.60377 type:complete len:156 (+) Transcript_32976:309-776(+)